jgi:multicomponent Na+:H+ antiporter subunit D
VTTHLPILIILPLLVMAFVVTLIGLIRPRTAFPLTIAAVLASVLASVWSLVSVVGGAPLRYALGGWAPPVGIEYVIDPISGFVATVVSVVAFLVLIGSRRMALREMEDRQGPFYGTVLMLLTGLLGIVVTGDLFNVFVFLEISSLATYGLIFMGGPKAMIASFRYLIVGTAGGALYLLGVGYLYFSTGTLNMADMAARLPSVMDSRAVLAGTVLIFVGIGVKVAIVPLHWWLPDAYNFAPSSVNTLIAPISTKVAAYLMLRMSLTVFPDRYLAEATPVASMLLVLGLAGAIGGGAAALGQSDLRRVLAYSSISQISLIAVGIGLGSPLAGAAALFHIMAHSVMKAALFLAASGIRYRTAQVDIDRMAGIARVMPLTMAAFAVASVSMVGLPPTAGFFSKLYLVQAAIQAGAWPVAVVVLISGLLTAAYLVRVLERAYFRDLRPETDDDDNPGTAQSTAMTAVRNAREVHVDTLVPTLLLAAGVVVLGLFNVPIMTVVLVPGMVQ